MRLQIFGAENAQGRITNYRTTTKDRITRVLEREAPNATEQMRQAMYAAYTQGNKTSGRSLNFQVEDNSIGPSVRITIGNYRQVKYMTTLVPDSEFKPGPYIITPTNASRLVFYFKRLGRWMSLKSVVHPGFPQGDVLRDTGTQIIAQLGRAVEQEVRSAVAEVHAGGTTFSVSRRR